MSELPAPEQRRLIELLRSAPGLASEAWRQGPVVGPDGLKLYWSIPVAYSYFLGPRPLPYLGGKWFLVVSLACGVLLLPGNRLIVWRRPPVDHERTIVRASVFDSTRLGRLRRSDLPARPRESDPVVAIAGLLDFVDFPRSWEPGRQEVIFPGGFSGCSEMIVPASFPGRLPHRLNQKLCMARPASNEVEVIELTWREAMTAGAFISSTARDQVTGRLVARAGGSRPFLVNADGGFGGWLSARA